jgi:hypothetical protein
MSDQNTNEFDVWQYETPVVIIGKDGEFDVWQYETPVEDMIEGGAAPAVTRRRFFDF